MSAHTSRCGLIQIGNRTCAPDVALLTTTPDTEPSIRCVDKLGGETLRMYTKMSL